MARGMNFEWSVCGVKDGILLLINHKAIKCRNLDEALQRVQEAMERMDPTAPDRWARLIRCLGSGRGREKTEAELLPE